MKLSNRAILLILPVVLISYVIAAIGVYLVQRESVVDLERSRLNQEVQELATRFAAYQAFADNYMVALLQGDALQRFLLEDDPHYRGIALSRSLRSAQTALRHQSADYIALAVIDRGGEVDYYFEQSIDPFAEIRPEQVALAEQLLDTHRLSDWQHLIRPDGRSMIVRSRLIDSRTFLAPLQTQLAHSKVVQVSVEPTGYDQMVRALEKRYQTRLQYTATPADYWDGIWAVAKLAGGRYIQLEIPPRVVNHRLSMLAFWLGGGCLFMAILSALALFWLVRRYITKPISRLERGLDEVMTLRGDNISVYGHRDEISRLAGRFRELYQQLAHAYRSTQELARSDMLTELPNRFHFREMAAEVLSDATTQGEQVALLYVDLDNFKFVNDKYGHEVGDKLLSIFSQRLMSVARLNDLTMDKQGQLLIARLSGDEFAMVLNHCDSQLTASRVAQRVLELFHDGFSFDGNIFPVSASIGIAFFPKDGAELDTLISCADAAMYQAKCSGKSRYAFYSSELANQANRAREIESELRGVDCDREFRLVYMPICDTRDASVESFETLLRWRSPLLGEVSPEEFIPIAEHSGLFSKIDYWVVKQALRELPQLQALYPDIKLSINLSSAELASTEISSFMQQQVRENNVDPTRIELEMTETFAVENRDRAFEVLSKLREVGFGIAIDDFGTGYTSLRQMVEYPVDKIKLDRSFLLHLTEAHLQSIVAPLIALCQAQQIKVTAEGVESSEQAEWLHSCGCDYQQGYFIGKAMALAEIPRWERARFAWGA